jgi:RNA polymerase sigma factor (sigma-70 family)
MAAVKSPLDGTVFEDGGTERERRRERHPEVAAPMTDGASSSLSAEIDNARFASAVLPHLDDAYALAQWLTGNPADAEDIVQDACVRAFRGIAGFAEGNARAWVLAIVFNTASSWLSKNRRQPLADAHDLGEIAQIADVVGPDAETAEIALIRKADSALLETLIAALPPVFRETLLLRDVQGLSYREISQVTGAPLGTVMSRLARARGRLRQAMSAHRL